MPTSPAVTLRAAATAYAKMVGAPTPRAAPSARGVLRSAGLFIAEAREFVEMRYQFERPFILDSSAARKQFGLAPTSLDDALRL